MFWKDGWNQFDAVIIAGTSLGLFLGDILNLAIGPVTLVIRMFRVCRILKLFRYLEQLNLIFNTFMMTTDKNICLSSNFNPLCDWFGTSHRHVLLNRLISVIVLLCDVFKIRFLK